MYHVIKRSVTGYKKLKSGKVCQDAVKSVSLKNAVVCAVADGHGDPRCKNSHKGALFAVNCAVSVLSKIVANVPLTKLYAHVLQNREQIIQSIIREWNVLTVEDFESENEAFETEKLQRIKQYVSTLFEQRNRCISSENASELFLQQAEIDDGLKRITHLYGTTLNAVLITKDFVFCLGIGDGDVTFVQNGKAYWMLPPSEQYSTSTSSLCYKPQKALEHFYSTVVRIDGKRKRQNPLFKTGINPDYIMVSTDGLRNSFVSDDHFVEKLVSISKGKPNYSSIKKQGKKWIETLTKESLYQDDITFCMIFNQE